MRKIIMTLAALLLLGMSLSVSMASATGGGGHNKPYVCHPVKGNGSSGYGWSLIAPDKASSHIRNGVPKHEAEGRWDVYATDGKCPTPEKPAPVVVEEVTEGTPNCDTLTVDITTTTTSTGWKWRGGKWVPDKPVVTTAQSTRPATDEECPLPGKPEPDVDYSDWVGEPDCAGGEFIETRTKSVTDWVLEGRVWVKLEPVVTTESRSTPVTDEQCPIPPKPEPDVTVEVTEGALDCESLTVDITKTTTTTDWILENRKWVLGEPVVTTESETRTATAEECPPVPEEPTPTDDPTCGDEGYLPIGDECETEEPTPPDPTDEPTEVTPPSTDPTETPAETAPPEETPTETPQVTPTEPAEPSVTPSQTPPKETPTAGPKTPQAQPPATRQVLPNTGGPNWIVMIAGIMLLIAGIAAVGANYRRRKH